MSRKVALVTGGSRGIGRAIACRLARQGCDVAIFYAGREDAARETVAELEALGARAMACRCNVADAEAVDAAVAEVKNTLGPVDILVNNAGITRDQLALRMKPEAFNEVIQVNLNGAFHTIHATYADFMRRRSGRIINITSVSGIMGNPGQANYASAKAGLIGLTKTIAQELAGRGVTCNAVAPGFVATDMTAAMNEQVLTQAVSKVPMKRMAQPEDIAGVVAFLAGDEAAYITGVVIPVDGGLSM